MHCLLVCLCLPHFYVLTRTGISAICAITANNPLEILRIRTQLLESTSKLDAEVIRGGYLRLASSIWKEEGWTAFYRGLRIRLIVTVPSAMVALSGYVSSTFALLYSYLALFCSYEVIKQFAEFK